MRRADQPAIARTDPSPTPSVGEADGGCSYGLSPPWSEAERLAALDRYEILDTGRETAFDDIAALAADILEAPIAVVNLIAADRQWFKAELGIGTDTLPLDVSICRYAILRPGVFVVCDLMTDTRFDGNPLVHAADGLRFYAGAALETPDGLPLGTVCVLDTKPRPEGLSERQARALKVLASQTMARLELRRSEALSQIERARAERHARRLSLLSEASSLLLATNDPAIAMRDLFGLIANGFRLDVGFHYRCNDQALGLMAAAGLTPEQERAAAQIEFGQTVCGIVAATREPAHVTGIQASRDPDVQFLKMLGLDSYFSAPLLSDGELLGTLSFGRRGDPFSTGELEALRALVAQFATALERRRAEHDLQESAERLGLATDNAEVGFWDVDPIGDKLIWPSRTKAMFGISPDVPVSIVDFYAGLHPEDRERTTAAYVAAADPARRTLYDVEYRTIGAEDGVIRWVAAKGRGLFDADGVCIRVVGTAIDVTARKRAETHKAALIELSDAIRDIQCPDDLALAAAGILGRALGVGRVGYAAVDAESETLHVERDWNAPGIESLAGTSRLRDYGSFIDSLKRGEFVAIPDVRDDERTAEAAQALESRGARAFVNVPFVDQGRLRAVLYVNHAEARDWNPDDLALIGDVAARVLTAVERLCAGAALRDSEARLRHMNETLEAQVVERTAERDRMWDTSPDLLLILDFGGIVRRVNPAWLAILGFLPEALVGTRIDRLVHPEDVELTEKALLDATGGPLPVVENRYRHKDGSFRWISWVAAPQGAMIYATGRHVSAEKEREVELASAQEALRQSQKMEAMGSLTGGVAHDFNNLLTPIVGSLDMLQRRGLGGEREQRLIAGAVQSAERAKTLVQRLLAFARRQPLQPVAVDLAPLVRGMADLVSSTTGPQIKVAVEAPDGLPAAKADPNQLEMAILNLAVNARDAMPNGGTLRISVETEAVDRHHRAGVVPGPYLKLSVADTGEGMDDATLKRAIEPFFSTKGIGKGTGLGLSMVHGLASQLGGALTISSKRGLGTNIELWLPCSAEANAVTEADPDPTLSPTETGGTALLVDDEDLVRLSTADMLSELGYAVVEAGSAEEALRLIEQGLAPTLLVTDHLMPGLSGTNLARALKDRWPKAKVLIVSGYAEADGIDPDLPRLTKPFRSADLAASLAALT